MQYNHALFLNPYIENHATSVMKLFPPTGLEYVAASAQGYVEKITLLDLRYENELANPVNLFDFIKEEIDIVCVSLGWDRQLKEICQLLSGMPAHIPLVVGGYKATEMVDELFKTCPPIRIIVRGEGEETIREILQGLPLHDILGISYRQNNDIIHNPNRPLPDVNSITPPDRSLRRNDYHLCINGVSVMNITFDSVLTTRGCPYTCKFCTFNLNPLGQKRNYAARSVDSVIEELKQINAQVILFSDDNLFADIQRSEELCDKIIANKIKKRYVAQARLEIAKYPRLLEKMVKAGFKTLLVGVESPHDRILKQLNKGFDSATIREAFKTLNRYPLFYSGYFIYGNIGETKEEMLYIAQFAKEIGLDSIACNKLRIERFSPLRALAEKTPGYHITERGELYSDTYDHPALKKIGKTIKFSFFTPSRYVKILWKNIFVTRFFTFGELLSLGIIMPRLIWAVIRQEAKKGRLVDNLKRTFIKNR